MFIMFDDVPVSVELNTEVQPRLFINGIERELVRNKGLRAKYFHDNFVVKLSDSLHSTRETEILYRHLANEDKIYFPKLLGTDPWFIVQEFVPMMYAHITEDDITLVKRLVQKYKLEDVDFTRDMEYPNWGLSVVTRKPVIVDYFLDVANYGY